MSTLVLWHGYLLGATGSNIYTRHIVESWLRAGHDVVLACQERHPEQFPMVHEVVHLCRDDAGMRVVEVGTVRAAEPGRGRCTLVRPDIHGLLPVYVVDRYEGFRVERVVDLDDDELAGYLDDHAAAMGWVLDTFEPDGVLVNHAAPLPAALAPVLEQHGVPFVVKVHGSELEYALVEDARRERPRLAAPAAAALAAARGVIVGSGHIARRTEELLGAAAVDGRVALVPPGVDLDRFAPLPAWDPVTVATARRALADLLQSRIDAGTGGRDASCSEQVAAACGGSTDELLARLVALQGTYEERLVEAGAAAAVRALADDADARVVSYVGKLIPQKGVHVLLAALPDVAQAHPDVQLVVAGFGPMRDALDAMLRAMATADGAALRMLAASAGSLSGEGGEALAHLQAWIDHLDATGGFDDWLARAAAVRVDRRVSWLGLVDHEVLSLLWRTSEASIVPSVLSEAFGMVAAEAAACGCVPLVSDHSGLADAAAVIERAGVAPVRLEIGNDGVGDARAVASLADALVARLALPRGEAARQARAARANVAGAWGWNRLAAQVAELMTTAPARAAGG